MFKKETDKRQKNRLKNIATLMKKAQNLWKSTDRVVASPSILQTMRLEIQTMDIGTPARRVSLLAPCFVADWWKGTELHV